VVRTSVLAGGLSISCARLIDGRVITLWANQPANKANSACHPFEVGYGLWNEDVGTADWGCLA